MFINSRGLILRLIKPYLLGGNCSIIIRQLRKNQQTNSSFVLLVDRYRDYISKQITVTTPTKCDPNLYISLQSLWNKTPSNLSQLSNEDFISRISYGAFNMKDASANLTVFDTECLRRIPYLTHRQLLELMHAFDQVIRDRFIRLDSYTPAMTRICESYQSHQPTADFVRICYYLGAAKKTGSCSQLLDAFVRRHFNKYIERVTSMDLAILATATYRAAVPLQLRHAKRFEQEILAMNENAFLDYPLLNAFIKILRLSRVCSGRVMLILVEWMQSGRLDDIEFRGLAHLFVFFADNRILDKEAMPWFCRQTMRSIQAASPEMLCNRKGNKQDLRAKDFRLFLWCLAHLNSRESLSVDELATIGSIVLKKFRSGEFQSEDDLVDLAMSLWQLGYGSEEMFRRIFIGYTPAPPAERIRVKLDGRKNLLFFCVELERPEWLDALGVSRTKEHVFQPDRKANKKFAKHSEELKRVYEAVCRTMSGERVEIVLPIRNLNIPGILVRSNANDFRYVEVLERHTVLSDGVTPFGTMQLKLRLLRHLGYRVDLVRIIVI